jgi:hypothetical protein
MRIAKILNNPKEDREARFLKEIEVTAASWFAAVWGTRVRWRWLTTCSNPLELATNSGRMIYSDWAEIPRSIFPEVLYVGRFQSPANVGSAFG